MKLIKILLFLALINTSYAAKITDPVLNVGKDASTDFMFLHKDGGYIKKTGSQGDWLFSTDGILEKKIGSGSGSGGSGGINVLLNASLEDGLTGWTNTGGTLTQETYANGLEGDLKYARFVATASGQYFEQLITTWPDKVSGGCMADFKYLQGDNSFTYEVIEDPSGTPKLLSSGTVSDLTEWVKTPTITMNCPTAGADTVLRIESLSAGTIEVDDLYLGSNKGFIAGTYKNSCALEGSDNRSVTFDTESIPFDGTCDGWTQGADGSSLTNGNYYTVQKNKSILTLSGSVGLDNAFDSDLNLYKNGTLYKRIYDARSTKFSNSMEYKYISRSGEFTVGDKLSFSPASTVNISASTIFHFLTINEQSSETQEAFTPEQADFFIDVSIGGTVNPVLSSTATPLNINSASLDMVLNSGSASIPCTGGNPSTGLTCSAGNEILGIVLNATRSGKYKTCFNFIVSSTASQTFRLVETGETNDTIIQQGKNIEGHDNTTPDSSIGKVSLCDTFTFSGAGKKTIKVMYESNSAGTVGAGIVAMERDAGLYDRDAHISVELVGHNVSRPIIQNMVDTSVKSGKRIESCTMSSFGGVPTAVTSDCDSWVDNFTDVAIGDFDFNYSNVWSEKPTCTCISAEINRNCSGRGGTTQSTTSKAKFSLYVTSTLTHEDGIATITCTGAR